MIEIRAAAAGLSPNPHGHGLAVVGIVMCIIAGLLVTGRMLTRIFMAKAVGWDDYTLALSMVLAVGMSVCFQMGVSHAKVSKDMLLTDFRRDLLRHGPAHERGAQRRL